IVKDGQVEGPYHERVTLTTSGTGGYSDASNTARVNSFVVNIADGDSPQVVVTESAGSTNVIEGGSLSGVYVTQVGNNEQITVDQTGTFSLSFGGLTASGLSFATTAAAMSTALNALSTIAAAGGVTVYKDWQSASGAAF